MWLVLLLCASAVSAENVTHPPDTHYIIGGRPAQQNEFPWQAAIQVTNLSLSFCPCVSPSQPSIASKTVFHNTFQNFNRFAESQEIYSRSPKGKVSCLSPSGIIIAELRSSKTNGLSRRPTVLTALKKSRISGS